MEECCARPRNQISRLGQNFPDEETLCPPTKTNTNGDHGCLEEVKLPKQIKRMTDNVTVGDAEEIQLVRTGLAQSLNLPTLLTVWEQRRSLEAQQSQIPS